MIYWGCHAVLFGEKIKTETGAVLEKLAKTGFTGIEAGFRFFGDNLLPMADELKRNKLLLSGFHAGIKFSDLFEGADKVGEFLSHIADKVLEVPEAVFPYRNIVMSSNYNDFTGTAFNGRPMEEAAARLNDIAGAVKKKGVVINYHNHSTEFVNDGAIYKVLRDHVPEMNFGFDLGWVEAGGGDPKAVLEETKGRVRYVHIRDRAASGGRDFVDLGQGVSDLPGIIALARETIGADGWIVVEYETGEVDYTRYTRAHDYLRTITRL